MRILFVVMFLAADHNCVALYSTRKWTKPRSIFIPCNQKNNNKLLTTLTISFFTFAFNLKRCACNVCVAKSKKNANLNILQWFFINVEYWRDSSILKRKIQFTRVFFEKLTVINQCNPYVCVRLSRIDCILNTYSFR